MQLIKPDLRNVPRSVRENRPLVIAIAHDERDVRHEAPLQQLLGIVRDPLAVHPRRPSRGQRRVSPDTSGPVDCVLELLEVGVAQAVERVRCALAADEFDEEVVVALAPTDVSDGNDRPGLLCGRERSG